MFKQKIWQKRAGDIEGLTSTSLLERLLHIRGISGQEDTKKFLAPSLQFLRDPNTFKGMDKAQERIIQAIKNGEAIGVFGDYDVDGVCSTALLVDFFSMLKTSVVQTLPHRLKEGYGLSKVGIDRLVSMGASLIITVDCGTVSFEEIDYANSLGKDVIVIDHHNALDELPKAHSIVNPKQNGCASGAQNLCAAGVAFYLCAAIRRELRAQNYFIKNPEPDIRLLLDLVALATVCDVVPLKEENRVFVKFGLKLIKKNRRLGLKKLLEVCELDVKRVSSTNLGFHLGPRINAAGRLEDATLALDLMNTKSVEEAEYFASILHEQNHQRQTLEKNTVAEICDIIDGSNEHQESPAIVLHNDQWHPGVVGIIASRIAEKYHKPSIIIGQKGKGSGRSIKGIDLYEMVSKASSHLAGFGGHFHAIGLTLKNPVEDFRADLNKVIKDNVAQKVFEKTLFYDDDLSLKEVSFELLNDLKKLEPFGASNPYPVFLIKNCYFRNLKNLNGGHVKGELENAEGFLEFIGFRMEVSKEFLGKPVDVLGILEENVWQNNSKLQLRLVDFMN